ncbi:hypothetical protein [Sporichthya sp.]|uniref:hypothetical protein n=1 Tax=Sporichthya sp. TaxID=65475 RepID=UPI001842952C|nr:hypothetical protein [Sporichthya sp.]MBA3742177.1 hypothetical protein [Sporichthya sp.]
MTTPGGEWVAVTNPGEPDRWDYVPVEQPPSPDGGPGQWHVVGGSGTEVGKWEWFPATAPPPPPPPPVLMPWETASPTPAPWEPTPSAPAPAVGEQETAPVFGAAPPAGWHAAPPVGAVPKQRRSRKLPLAIVGVVVVVAAIAAGAVVLLGGGDDGKDKEEITALVNYVTTVDDGKDVCTSHLTEKFVTTVFGDVATCENDDDDSDDDSADATGATVTNIKIEKDTATGLVTVIGGDTDGATGTWAFLKGDDENWRVSDWRADYLRSSFERTFGDTYDSDGPDDPFADEDVRGCVKEKLLGQDDLAFLDTAYKLFRNSDDSVEKLLGFMSECPSDTAGVSALRALFEKGFRESAQLPPAITECIVLGMRTGLSEDDIKALSINRDEPMPADVQSRIEQITIGCAGGPTTFDPTPSDFGTAPPAFGT